jgi:hypothetical protein
MKYVITGFCLGLLVSAVRLLVGSITHDPLDLLHTISYPVCWGIAGYLAWRWDILGTNGVGRE